MKKSAIKKASENLNKAAPVLKASNVVAKKAPVKKAPVKRSTRQKVVEQMKSQLDIQVGGDHYKLMGHHQPVEVLQTWLTPEEFRGYMKGTAISYLARKKADTDDIGKAQHTLAMLQEILNQ
jgi:mRNA-degrading endonuclease HigB of HigAB toxin-antitoxin module